MKNALRNAKFISVLLIVAFLSAVYSAFATPPASKYLPGETLDPTDCGPGDPNCSVVPMNVGDEVGSATDGSVLFVDASGNLGEDNNNFFWDDATDRLGIGTDSPAYRLDIATTVATGSSIGTVAEVGGGLLDDLTIGGTYTGTEDDTIFVYIDSTGATDTFAYTSNSGNYEGTGITITAGTIDIDDGITATFGATTGHDGNEVWQFDVTAAVVTSSSGDFNFGGSIYKNGAPWSGALGGMIEGATTGGILFTNASGNLKQDASNFFWDNENNRLGLGTTSPSEQLQITKNFRFPTTTSSSVGVFMKDGTRFLHTYKPAGSNDNLFIGKNSGNFTLNAAGNAFSNGNANTGVGENALASLTSGVFNTTVGGSAGRRITTGSDNNFFGLQAGNNITTGSKNVAIGESALYGGSGIGTATGSRNVAIGETAMYEITSGVNNVAIGISAGQDNNSGSNNIFIGFQAGNNVTTGSNNIIIGYDIDAQSATNSNQLSIGNAIYGDLATGNIGIGDTTVSSLFSVGAGGLFKVNSSGIVLGPDGAAATPTYSFTGATTTGMYSPAAKEVALATNSAERVRIDSSGNFGIGDSTPASLFTVGSGDLFQVNSSGLAFAPAGLASAPTYSFVGNTGVGMFSGGTNTLDFATNGVDRLQIDSAGGVSTPDGDFGDGSAGPVINIGRNTNGTNTGAGSINFKSKAGTRGYVWQDNAGEMRINTSAPSNANDTSGTVIGAQLSIRSSKQDIIDYTSYDDALQMVLDAPLHYFRYKKEVSGYGENSPLAKERLGFIADEVDPLFMWNNTIDQVSVNGILLASVKALDVKIEDLSSFDLDNENSLANRLIAWFADAANGIGSFFAGEIHTDKLCVGDTCVTEEEFLNLVNQNQNGNPPDDGDNAGGGGPVEDVPADVPEDGGDIVPPDDAVAPPGDEEPAPEVDAPPAPPEEAPQDDPAEPPLE